MHFGFFSSLVSTFLAIHAMLYHPVFATFPEGIFEPTSSPSITLSIRSDTFTQPQKIFASAAIVIDQNSGEILFAQNADEKLAPASTTKIMTALLTIENYDLSKVASVSSGLARDGSAMGLVAGEHIRIQDLLTGLLIPSANDAADELSRLYPGGTTAFVERMNQRAKELHLTNTHYNNPIGYEDPNHVTSVRDLSILAREAMKHPEFSSLVKVRTMTVRNVEGTIEHHLKSTNELLDTFIGIEGIKTGWTQEAGECFVAQATRGNQTYVSVVLHSPDRFGETRTLLNWAFTNYTTQTKVYTDF